MKPSTGSIDRRPVEFQPARNYLCYLRYDSVVFFLRLYIRSADTLKSKSRDILKTILAQRLRHFGI